ncbi:MAG: VOC family protein [Acidobacteria bacterium]|nr:VOC family protein [Acidobacteriota bacterium]
MTDWPGPLAAITLFTEDLAAAREFYSRVFGVPVSYEDSNSCVFTFGGTMINLLQASEAVQLIAPATPGGAGSLPRMQFTLGVDDVDAKAAELVELGVHLLNGPMDREWGIRTASFRDPAGNIWEIAASLTAAG